MEKVVAFLHVYISLCNISREYAQAIGRYCGLEPAILCLPWPLLAIPPVGAKVCAHHSPLDMEGLTVIDLEYVLDSKNQLRVEINTDSLLGQDGSEKTQEKILWEFAKAGFYFYSCFDVPIDRILTEAGLSEPE